MRDSFRTGRSIQWTRVHDLPDFVYFNHSIHVNKGVGCTTCHGRVDRMPLMWQEHRCRWSGASTATAIRSSTSGRASAVFSVDYVAAGESARTRPQLVAEYQIQKLDELLDVSPMNRLREHSPN